MLRFFNKPCVNTLFVKIFALFWLTFGLLLVFAFLFPQLDTRRYSDIDSVEIKNYQQKILTAIRERAFMRLLVAPDFLEEHNNNEVHLILVDQDKNIFGATGAELPFVQEFITTADDPVYPKTKALNNRALSGPFSIYLNNDGLQNPYLVYFLHHVDPQREIINDIFDHPILLILFILLISSPILGALVYSLTKPIRRLQIAANAVALGDFSTHYNLETTGAIELRQVGKSFNKMAQSLGSYLESRQQMFTSVSHELRTPLTRLQLATALLRRKIGENDEIQRIELEVERLNRMIEDVLLLTRKRMENTMNREYFSISQIWERVLSDAKFEAEQMGIQIEVNESIKKREKYQIYGNQEGLASALENVVRNSLKYTTDYLLVSLQVQNNFLLITVDDNGQGLAEEEYSRIFIPFYRVDDDITKSKKGFGLGLAIVYNCIQLHTGEVWAEKSHLGGLRIQIKLPIERA